MEKKKIDRSDSSTMEGARVVSAQEDLKIEESTNDEPEGEKKISFTLAANFFLLVFLGTFISWWIFYYTDWFETYGSFLALGGIFSWLAFLFRIVSEDHAGTLKKKFEEKILLNPRVTKPLLLAILIPVVFFSFFGSVQVESYGNEPEFEVNFKKSTEKVVDVQRLLPGGKVRSIWFTSFWSSPSVLVKVAGFPDREVNINPWGRVDLRAPGSFTRPVLLLRPSEALIQMTRNNAMLLVVRSDSASTKSDFNGSSVWIGCSEDVAVPERVKDLWRTETANARIFYLWSNPVSVPGCERAMKPGSKVRVAVLVKEDGHEYYSKEITLKNLVRPLDFPQVEDLSP